MMVFIVCIYMYMYSLVVAKLHVMMFFARKEHPFFVYRLKTVAPELHRNIWSKRGLR